MKTTKIGAVRLVYNNKGQLIIARVKPEDFIKNELSPANDLAKAVDGLMDEQRIKEQAQMVLASWFNHLNNVELSDKFESELTSEIVSCSKWPNGTVKECTLQFTLQEIKHEKTT